MRIAGRTRIPREAALLAARLRRPEIAIAHEFHTGPYGGSNQFLVALRGELRRRGLRVEANAVTRSTRACLLNAFLFDADRLRRSLHPGCRVVHRIDGPVGTYRGADDGTDRRLAELNAELAHATIFQSRYSADAHRDLGLEFREPVVIHNAVDPAIFFPPQRRAPAARIRVVATSWSANPNKGSAVYSWLDEHIDRSRYELTFVGNIAQPLRHGRTIPPLPSAELAEVLRASDVYITASLHDPCSNALLEALACGLPALFANSGGHPELVGAGGLPFDDREELPELLNRLAGELDQRRAAIRAPRLADVADRYLAVMGFV